MPRTVYFDCFSGASGDMVLGALLDLGLPLEALRQALGSLALDVGGIGADRVLRAGVSATRFRAAAEATPAAAHAARESGRAAHGLGGAQPTHDHTHGHQHAHYSLSEITRSIERSALSTAGRARAVAMFRRLAEAEAEIHQVSLERVHLHEVGAPDSIVDIVGAVFGMEWLGADEILSSPLNVGSGTVRCAHGVFPVPAPATALLLKGVPIYAGEVAMELVTPTGALVLTEYAGSFGALPPMRVDAIGYGAGDRDVPGHPNVLRLLRGERTDARASGAIVVLECEIDDMNPQLFGPLMDRLFEAGAADVYYAPVQMKKNRPGVLVTVLAPPSQREALTGVLFTETTTIGVRYQEVQRECLAREVREIDTPIGAIRFKIASRGGRILNASPEFDDLVRAAASHRLAIKDAQAIATRAWLESSARD